MNIYTDKTDKYFRCSNLYASAFLFAKGLVLVNIDKLNPKKAIFVFIDTPDREFFFTQYNFAPENSSDCLIDARKFILAIKTLKERLYQNNT